MMEHGLKEAYVIRAGDYAGQTATVCECKVRFVRERLVDGAIALERHVATPGEATVEYPGRRGVVSG